MPAQATNGSNPTGSSGLESSENCSFLFTSESVGEGHPGKKHKIRQIRKKNRQNVVLHHLKVVKNCGRNIQGTSWHNGKLMFQQFLSELKDGVFLNSDSFEALFHYFLRGNFGLRLT